MASLPRLWSILQSVQSLHFESRSEAATGWNGIGTGTVTTTMPDADTIIFNEAGTWQSPGRPAIQFGNVYRWSNINGLLRLEHLRFGPDHPVYLFDMAPNDSGEWREAAPHQCREDCYTAALKIEGNRLHLAWSIVGPRKRETINYTYY